MRVSDQRVHDSTFLSYLLGTEEARAWIVRHAVGATMLNLNTSILGRLPLRIPGVSTQRAIAEVLGALDDKIAANERVVSLCDVLAKTHFEAATSEQRARRLPLSSLARFINGRAFTKAATGSGRVVIRIAELNSGIGASTVYNDIDVAE
ncbi:MAG: restriction endonuclease subunit S, partial [Microthrixaceae bacterium]|nr:restriction endonuclease subunit S [Microthrixaceae bacterium]